MAAAEQQLECLVRQYEHRVGFFARKVQRSFMLDGSSRDDLLSAGYWGLFKALRNRRADAQERELSAYVSKRIHGAVIDAARSFLTQAQGTQQTRGSSEEDRDTGPECGLSGIQLEGGRADGPEAMVGRVFQQAAIRLALERLGSDDQRVLLAYMEGSSLAEIAHDEGVAVGTMQGRFRKLAQRLRAQSPELRQILLDRDPQ